MTVIDLPTRANVRYGLPAWALDVDEVRERAHQDAATRLAALLAGPTGHQSPELIEVPVTHSMLSGHSIRLDSSSSPVAAILPTIRSITQTTS